MLQDARTQPSCSRQSADALDLFLRDLPSQHPCDTGSEYVFGVSRLRQYSAPTVHWFARLLVLTGWMTSISIVALVPIDVWATLQHTQNKSINVLWSISYWCGAPHICLTVG